MDDGRRVVESWPTTEDLRHGIVLASSFSNEERAHPATPYGVNVAARRRFRIAATGTVANDIDATSREVDSKSLNPEHGNGVGPVALAVDQNFGLTPSRPYRVATDEQTVAAGASELTEIGRTTRVLQRYRVTLLGIDAEIAHLALTPLRDPYHNRLRELWIETSTANVREAIVEGIGDRAPFDRARWHVAFAWREGGMYVTEASSLEPLRIGRGTPQVRVAFENVALLAHSPIKTTFGIEAPVRYLRDP
jgi:hypothetical protein